MPDRLHFTESDAANALIATDPMALLIGFALDQQVSVQKAFAGPLAIRERLGSLDAQALASADPAQQKPRPLLRWVEDKLTEMLAEIMRAAGRDIDYAVLPNLIMMAYDGFVMNRRLNDLRDIDRLADAMCDLTLGKPD